MAILFITSVFSIHSQPTSGSDNQGKFVSYEKLNEFAKYVEFKSYADSLIVDYQNELNQAYILLGIKDQKIHQLKNILIPQKDLQIQLYQSQQADQRNLMDQVESTYQGKITSLKKSVFTWSGIAALLGIITGILISNG